MLMLLRAIDIKRICMFALSNIVNETEAKSLAVNLDDVKFFLETLQESVASKNHYSIAESFSTMDLLTGLKSLAACSEEIAIYEVNNGVIQSLEHLFDRQDSFEEEILASIKLIWVLSFNQTCKDGIIKSKVLDGIFLFSHCMYA